MSPAAAPVAAMRLVGPGAPRCHGGRGGGQMAQPLGLEQQQQQWGQLGEGSPGVAAAAAAAAAGLSACFSLLPMAVVWLASLLSQAGQGQGQGQGQAWAWGATTT